MYSPDPTSEEPDYILLRTCVLGQSSGRLQSGWTRVQFLMFVHPRDYLFWLNCEQLSFSGLTLPCFLVTLAASGLYFKFSRGSCGHPWLMTSQNMCLPALLVLQTRDQIKLQQDYWDLYQCLAGPGHISLWTLSLACLNLKQILPFWESWTISERWSTLSPFQSYHLPRRQWRLFSIRWFICMASQWT